MFTMALFFKNQQMLNPLNSTSPIVFGTKYPFCGILFAHKLNKNQTKSQTFSMHKEFIDSHFGGDYPANL